MTEADQQPAPLPPVPEPASVRCGCLDGTLAHEMAQQHNLLNQAVRGNTEAFGELFEQEVDLVYRYLFAWVQDAGTAERLTRTVFTNALRWLPLVAWREETELGAWLIGMARDAIVEERESAEREPANVTPLPGPPLGSADAALSWERLRPALSALDDEAREVVILRFLLGHSAAHTAYLMGRREGAVELLQLQACEAIADWLEGRTPPGGRSHAP